MYQETFSMFVPYLIITGVVFFLIGVIYLISRVRSGQIHFSFKHALEGYFYLMMVISFIIFTFGLVSLVNVGISRVAGNDFSYGFLPSPIPVPEGVYPPGYEPAQQDKLTLEEQEELRKKQEELWKEEEQRQLDYHKERQFLSHREGISEGIGMAFVGGIVWFLHLWGRRKFYVSDAFSKDIMRAYLVLMLSIFSVTGIVAITTAVSRVLRLYILFDFDRSSYVQAPGPMVAAAIIFVPVWIYYLASLIKELRNTENEEKAIEA